MIIFGTTGIRSTMKNGNFSCPQCSAVKPYKHKKVTKFFTLYFIPLIPLGKAGEYVECQACRGTYVANILENNDLLNKDEYLAVYEHAIRHSMIQILLADGRIFESEIQMARNIINKFTHHEISIEELEQMIEIMRGNTEPISIYLSKVASSLNEHGKEIIIQCALAVATADGELDQTEIDKIMEMAKALGMSANHLKGILHEHLT